MACEYGEKLILYFYGEAAGELKAGVESHLKTCAPCRGELAALAAAEDWLRAGAAAPSAAVMTAVLAQAANLRASGSFGFRNWTEALFAGALTAVMAVGFSLSARNTSPGLAWNSGLDSGLDSVEYSIYQAQAETSAAQTDWEYNSGLLEAEIG
ncbi:MAG: hypothetical protein A2234_02985 [Elusimicrobia bacterium RIFOXYA2_FULL_58_8]|nr:MAG: hypothetical protein A2234_02985 [Elusimicrobia bacterium RIFOXYA2_FULL_58_8]